MSSRIEKLLLLLPEAHPTSKNSALSASLREMLLFLVTVSDLENVSRRDAESAESE